MSTLNHILRPGSSSVQSRSRLSTSRAGSWVCATLLAGIVLFSGSAKAAVTPYNVLFNSGVETGDLTGWTTDAAVGYIYVVSTNGTMIGVTNGTISTNKFLAHSGAYTIEMFNTTGPDYAAIYQEFAAISNSQWSASCWAICYASNYFISGANAHMQVVFYDISNNVVPYPSSSYGVFGSQFLDPVDYSSFGITWTTVPPGATDPSGWLFLQPTNLYTGVITGPPDFVDQATEANYDSTGYPTNLVAPVGTAKVRYQLRFDNSGYGGGAVYFDDCALTKLNQSNPDITNAPVAVTVYESGSPSFSVVATHTGQYPGEKLTYQWEYNGVPLPSGVGTNHIAGSTTNSTLSFTNTRAADSGMYDVVVTVKSVGNYTNSIRSVPVPLTVLKLSPRQKANVLGANAGFENGPSWPPFEPFNGCFFVSSNAVDVFDGNWACMIGSHGVRDHGFHHAYGTGVGCTYVPSITPGSIWKAGGWAYIQSTNEILGGNTWRIQIWFRDADGNSLTASGTPTFESFKIYGLSYTNADMMYTNIDLSSPNYGQVLYHDQLPRDTWCYLPVTNVVNNAGIGLGDDLPIGTWNNGYFVVPTNAAVAQINFQVYEYCPQAADNIQPPYLGAASSRVYWDDMELFQVLPVTNLTAATSISGNTFNLSFDARPGITYAILYKTNLDDAAWSVLTTVEAPMSWQTNLDATTTTYPLTVSDPITAQRRFYQVRSQ
jgi:hypothetical protein